MSEAFDPLYHIFEKHLHSRAFDHRPEQELIDAIVQEYLVLLVTQGVAPHAHTSSLRDDVAAEVRDMLKMKIYGHFDVRHYNMTSRKFG